MAYSPVILTKGDRERLHKIKLRLQRRLALCDAEEARLKFKLVVCHEHMRRAGIPVPPPSPIQEELNLCSVGSPLS
jgi:hypothetical protein